MIQRRDLLIGGAWVDGVDGGEITVVNPYTGLGITRVAEATAAGAFICFLFERIDGGGFFYAFFEPLELFERE